MAARGKPLSARVRQRLRRELGERVPDGRTVSMDLSDVAVDVQARVLAERIGEGRRAVVSIKSPGAAPLRALAVALPATVTARELRVQLPGRLPMVGRVRMADVRSVAVDTGKSGTTLRLRVASTAPLSDLLIAVAAMANPAASPLSVGSVDAHVNVSGHPEIASLTTHSWIQIGAYPEGEAAAVEAAAAATLPRATARSDQPAIDIATANPVGLKPPVTAEVGRLDFDATGSAVLSLGATRFSLPANMIFSERVRAAVRDFPTLDIAATTVQAPDSAYVAARRIAELAAAGVVLRSDALPAGLASCLAPGFLDTISGPVARWGSTAEEQIAYRATSRAQTSAALRLHGGAFQMGHLPLVSVLLVTNRPGFVAAALAGVRSQTYPNVEVVLGMHGFTAGDLPAEVDLHDVLAVELDGSTTLGAAYGEITRRSRGDLLAKFDDDDLYGPDHLWDLVLAQAFTGAGLVGKAPRFTFLESTGTLLVRRGFGDDNVWGRYVIGATMLVSRAALLEVGGWRPTPWAVDKALLDRFGRHGMGVFRATGLGWIYVRRPAGHTWAADESYFTSQAEAQWSGDTTALQARILEGPDSTRA